MLLSYSARLTSLLLLLLACAAAHGQVAAPQSPATPPPAQRYVRLSDLTSNNTAACPAEEPLPARCKQPFAGQQDIRPNVFTPIFDPPAGNVSDEDIHGYLYQGQQTKIFANFMMGFCTEGEGPRCHNNVRVGYNSDDDRTVAAQVEDLRRRHIDGAIVSWSGSGTRMDDATVKFQRYVNSRYCNGPQHCDPMYVIMYDSASLDYNVESTGVRKTTSRGCGKESGRAYENCVVTHIRNDMCYLNGTHFGNDAYLKSNGRPVLLIFPKGGVIPPSGGAPSWADVWKHVDDFDKDIPKWCGQRPYNANNGIPLLVFEHADGFTHQSSSGAYAWVRVKGTDPRQAQFNFSIYQSHDPASLDGFYQAARQNLDKQIWGAAYKGFNSSQSAWGTNRLLDQECGRLWVASLTESNRFFNDRPLPFLQLVTWNDYNEGTEIESGIDNCLRVEASANGDTLSWTLRPTTRIATLATVSRVEIYDSTDGENLTLLQSVQPASSGTVNLASLRPGPHQLFVRMVGKNSILNRVSAAVRYGNSPQQAPGPGQ